MERPELGIVTFHHDIMHVSIPHTYRLTFIFFSSFLFVLLLCKFLRVARLDVVAWEHSGLFFLCEITILSLPRPLSEFRDALRCLEVNRGPSRQVQCKERRKRTMYSMHFSNSFECTFHTRVRATRDGMVT